MSKCDYCGVEEFHSLTSACRYPSAPQPGDWGDMMEKQVADLEARLAREREISYRAGLEVANLTQRLSEAEKSRNEAVNQRDHARGVADAVSDTAAWTGLSMVDDAVLAVEGHGGLAAIGRQRVQPRALASRHHEGQHLLACDRVWTEVHDLSLFVVLTCIATPLSAGRAWRCKGCN